MFYLDHVGIVRQLKKNRSARPSAFVCFAALLALFTSVVAGCGGGGASAPPPPQAITVTVTPTSQSVLLGVTQQFTATVTGTANMGVAWSVNGVSGGNATVGTISSSGLYTAPGDLPSPARVTVTATSQADTSRHADSSITVTSDIAVAVATNPAFTLSVPTGSTVPMTASITSQGKPDQKLNWSVNGITGGNSTVGTVSETGPNTATYQAPAAVPTPFIVTISATTVADTSKAASLPMIVAGTVASISQFISAASGGTITLPDGSNVTIPASVLSADQTVTLSELSVLPQQPPNQLVVGVGPSLQVTLTTPVPSSAASGQARIAKIRQTAQSGTPNDPDIVFTINEQSISAGLNGSLGLSTLTDVAGNSTSLTTSSNFDSTTSFASLSMHSSWLSNLGSSVKSFGVSLVNNVLLIFPKLFIVSQLPANKCWDTSDPNNPQWKDFSSCSSQISGKKVLVVVHGMMSCVEGMAPSATISGIQGIQNSNYGVIVGFDYDWTQHLADSAALLAAYLGKLGQLGAQQIDMLAHSEGVPVSLYAASQASDRNLITNFVGLAGPIVGTPVASDPSTLLQVLLHLDYQFRSSCPLFLKLSLDFTSISQQPFQQDLQKDSQVLTKVILPQVAANLSSTRIFLAGGTNPGPLQNVYNLTGSPFGSTPNDGVVGLDSSLGYNSQSIVHPLPPFNLFHADLPKNTTKSGALSDMANQVSHNSSPQFNCQSALSGCEGAQDSPFIFTGSGFSPNVADIQIFNQNQTGAVAALQTSGLQDSGGTISWSMPICQEPAGLYSIFSFDGTLASNNIMQKVDVGNCQAVNPVPTLASVSPTAIPVGNFTLTLNGTNFVPGAQAFFGATALSTQFVSSTQLTATGTATVSQVGNVPVTVNNPPPGGGTSNSVSVTVVNTSSSGSGSTGIIPGTVNGQLVDKAYVPQPNVGSISVVNVDSQSSTGALITTIPMPAGYTPNATAVNPATSIVVVISYSSPDVQVIDAIQDKLVATYTSPVTQFAGFSGGNCMICGALVDPSTNHAVLDTAQGTLLLDLTTGQFGSFIPSLAAENFAFNSNSRIALLPTYSQLGFVGLQALNVDTGALSQYSASVGSSPDSAAVDLTTNLAVIPDEFSGVQYIVNMQQATFAGGSFSAPLTSLSLSACGNEWTMVSIENVSHILFLGAEFDSCAAVEQLPSAPVSGPPPTPTSFVWGQMPATPDGFIWNNGGDPHGIAVFTSVVNGRSYGFLVDANAPWVARIDLVAVTSAPPLSGGAPGQVDLTPFVFFIQTQ